MPIESQLLFLLSPAAILVAAGLAWKFHRKIAARDATLRFIAEKEIHNEQWLAARAAVYRYTESGSFTGQDSDKASLALVLRHYELVAVAIRNKSIDTETYKLWNLTSYVNTWKRVASYVHSRRQKTGQQTMYCEFESLATEWDDSASTNT